MTRGVDRWTPPSQVRPAFSRWRLGHKQTQESALLAPQRAAPSGPVLSVQAPLSTRACGCQGPDIIWGRMQAEPLEER